MSKVNTFHRLIEMLGEPQKKERKTSPDKKAKKKAHPGYAFINPFHNI